jgi:NADH:ubiquinone oxidoreductase subunit 5 (subunit L)/multisubunit Na+/H+ antiporter MnhA subunit
MPIYAGFFLFMIFASIGLPGLNGFVGEFLVLIGSYTTLPVLTIIAASGVILAAIYLLWAYERVFTGIPDKEENKTLSDLSPREISLLAPLAVLVVLLGLYPNILLDKIAPSTEAVLDHIEASTDYAVPAPGRLGDVLVAQPSNTVGVSPALEATGGAAVPRSRLRPFSLPVDADGPETRSTYLSDGPLVAEGD